MTPVDGVQVGSTEGSDLTIFDQLYDEFKSPVYRFSYYLTRDRMETEELFQEAWLRVVQNLSKIPDVRDFKAWIFTIIANVHRDMLRKKKVRKLFAFSQSFERVIEPTSQNTGDNIQSPRKIDISDRVDMKRSIHQAMMHLPNRQRRVFVLKEIEGFKISEISVMLNLPVGTVKSLLHRAIRRLRQDLSEYRHV